MNHKIDRDTYIIPPNFIESGTFFGGMFKARNVIEAGILAFAIGVPVFSLLPLSLTARIIALCLTALPAALVALIGISGESLSSFLLIFIKYLRNRRIIGGNSAEDAGPAAEHGGKHNKKKATGQTKKVTADKARTSRPIAVKEVKVAKQETTSAAPTATIPTTTAVTTPVAPAVQPQANHPFHIIVAGGIGLKDAEAMAEQLKAKGFAEAKALNSDGKVRVSIRSFGNREEATKQLLELRKNETYKNAWLLAK